VTADAQGARAPLSRDEWVGANGGTGPAESARKSDFFSRRQPPPPANENWRIGARWPGNNTTFAVLPSKLAERVGIFSPPNPILIGRAW